MNALVGQVEVDELLDFVAQLPLNPVDKVLRRTVREDCRKRFG